MEERKEYVFRQIPILVFLAIAGHWVYKWSVSGILMSQVVFFYQLVCVSYVVLFINYIRALSGSVVSSSAKIFIFAGFMIFQGALGWTFFSPEFMATGIPMNGLFYITAFAAACCGAMVLLPIMAIVSTVFFLIVLSAFGSS